MMDDDLRVTGLIDFSFTTRIGDTLMVFMSRIRTAPCARLGRLSFECTGAFPSQC